MDWGADDNMNRTSDRLKFLKNRYLKRLGGLGTLFFCVPPTFTGVQTNVTGRVLEAKSGV